MNVLSKLWSALAELVEAVKGLAGTVRASDQELKRRLQGDQERTLANGLEPKRIRQAKEAP